MIVIPKELFGLKIEVLRSLRKTSVLHIIGDAIQVRIPNRVEDRKIVEILEKKKNGLEIKPFNYKINLLLKRKKISVENLSLFLVNT